MRNSKLLFLAFFFIGGTWAFEACNNGAQKTSSEGVEAAKEANDTSSVVAVDEADMNFAVKAADGSLAEVEMGKLGQEKATNPSIKEFAGMVVTDHSKANEELKTLATVKGIKLPLVVSEDHQHHLTDLTQTKANDFDKAYVDMMVEDHQKDVELFEEQAKNGKDAELKTFAVNTLPTLRKHLDAVNALKENLKK